MRTGTPLPRTALRAGLLLAAMATAPAFGWRSADLPVGAAPAPAETRRFDCRELERLALALANAERSRQGLSPLAADPALARVARSHSRAMRDLDFFGHLSPRAGSRTIGMRLAREGVTDAVYGENVGLYGTGRPSRCAAELVGELHRRLLDSPVHRANLLNPGFNFAGIGIVAGETRCDARPDLPLPAVWMTQNFVSRRLHLVPPRLEPTPTGLAVVVGGSSPAGEPVWLRTSSPRRPESVVAVPLSRDASRGFSTRVPLPAGEGTYRIEICAGPDPRRAVPANAILVDTHAPPASAIRSALADD